MVSKNKKQKTNNKKQPSTKDNNQKTKLSAPLVILILFVFLPFTIFFIIYAITWIGVGISQANPPKPSSTKELKLADFYTYLHEKYGAEEHFTTFDSLSGSLMSGSKSAYRKFTSDRLSGKFFSVYCEIKDDVVSCGDDYESKIKDNE